jgi:hypothetical protein
VIEQVPVLERFLDFCAPKTELPSGVGLQTFNIVGKVIRRRLCGNEGIGQNRLIATSRPAVLNAIAISETEWFGTGILENAEIFGRQADHYALSA